MKYLKYLVIALIVVSAISYVGFSASSHYSFFSIQLPTYYQETIINTIVDKEETNNQRLQSYSTSQSSVKARVYTIGSTSNGTSSGVYSNRITIAAGTTVAWSSSDIAQWGIGSYKLCLKNPSIFAKNVGGVWWLDESYYNAAN